LGIGFELVRSLYSRVFFRQALQSVLRNKIPNSTCALLRGLQAWQNQESCALMTLWTFPCRIILGYFQHSPALMQHQFSSIILVPALPPHMLVLSMAWIASVIVQAWTFHSRRYST